MTKTLKLSDMTKAEARVAIAKDVLRNLRFLRICRGNYCTGMLSVHDKTEQIQDHVKEVQMKCEVCALGACVISAARLFNHLTFGEASDEGFDGSWFNLHGDDVYRVLRPHFGGERCNLIEHAFEKGMHGHPKRFREAAAAFGEKYLDHHQRLRAIMLNIVRNQGEFRP